MAKWRPMTENEKRQQKAKIQQMLRENRIFGLPREKKKLARNKETDD